MSAGRGGVSPWTAPAKTRRSARSRARFDKMTAAVFLDFKGMTVEHVTKLRAEFRKAGVEYKVVKNTLVKHALKDAPVQGQARRRPRRHDGHRVELRRPERGRQGRQGVPQGPRRARSSRSRQASSRARCSTRRASRTSSRRCPARTSSAPCCSRRSKRRSRVRRAAPGPRAELRLPAVGEGARRRRAARTEAQLSTRRRTTQRRSFRFRLRRIHHGRHHA